ncbi:MAG: Amidophosphoribosyltransferase-like protein [Candidatus Wolfebacteria bacterium GW2011_GWC2_39_22]|uniref:Amidophosphoribosyltransferase-like protein n=1 Tax=Candidatus Wolfebacteria bacterium GW2011_GWC2_39_22 TaxID=1619013 RepID=A0A0G0N977_9BACT|nr:MAG: Amidophosphoribosyltransferase-like protein [Candidatus Wolfebacteria bacterium GW2011_GWC2_39_22]HBI25624.1 hypothetical protein [Candidatus Wolfebacteria bacterium]
MRSKTLYHILYYRIMKNGKLNHLFSLSTRMSRIALDILFSPLCAQCEVYLDSGAEPICKPCYQTIIKNSALICPICTARIANNKRTCNHSEKLSAQFPYLLGAAAQYSDPIVRNCIHQCKYEKVHALTKTLSLLLITYAQGLDPQPRIFTTNPIIVPIPLHTSKEHARGFNQSAYIAQAVAHAMHFPYDELLVKCINNDPQAKEKTHAERFARMHGAFAIPRPDAVRNKNIILIDDVSTSGATLSEAARTLKRAGAKQILALVIAKA